MKMGGETVMQRNSFDLVLIIQINQINQNFSYRYIIKNFHKHVKINKYNKIFSSWPIHIQIKNN